MRSAVAGLLDELAARAQPDPVAVGMTHAKGMIDLGCLGLGELRRQLVQIDVFGMHENIHLAEAHERIPWPQAQDREHGMRPEDASAREIPVP